MKDKRGSYGGEFSPLKNVIPVPSHSYTFKKQVRKTLGSDEDLDDKLTWNNISSNKISPFYSPPKYKNQSFDIRSVLEQNDKLKQEIKALKQFILDSSKYSKANQLTDSIRTKKDQKNKQIQRLRKIIEMSYYSIKQMQQQIGNINDKLLTTNRNYAKLESKNNFLEIQKQELQRKVISTAINHQKEMDKCFQRIHKLEMWTEMLNKMIEEDRKNWNSQTYQLNNLKKFYFGRRASG